MISHYRNTISVVYLLVCIFITSSSASSFLRQFTDDFNTNLQRMQSSLLFDFDPLFKKIHLCHFDSLLKHFKVTFSIFCLQTEENGAGPNPNVGEADHLHQHQEISSRDHKVSVSSTVNGLRDRPPSSYSLKMESFNKLLNSPYTERYQSRPFTVGGYNW